MSYLQRLDESTAQAQSCVVALHCSLGSGRQWSPLVAALAHRHKVIAPDISGYGEAALAAHAAATLTDEVEFLQDRLAALRGPIHLVGHSHGGAVAFKIAAASRLAARVRSLTLIEPILPAVLLEQGRDRHLYEHFARLANRVCAALWRNDTQRALDHFLTFWNGEGAVARLSEPSLARMAQSAHKLTVDFTAGFAETKVLDTARRLTVPVLLFSGGLSPFVTQRIVGRLASSVANARAIHLPAAGHMLAITHAAELIPDIADHIADADERAVRCRRPAAARETPAEAFA